MKNVVKKTPVESCVVIAAVFCSFLAYSFLQAPVPAPNEPHYLTKAKRYWNPDFCLNDVFLDSADAHTVYYQTVGLLTTFLDFPTSACVARVVAYLLLAISWTACVSRLAGSAGAAVWSAWIFLALATFGNLSGEWIVGGVEAKIFAYAFLFASVPFFVDRHWTRAAICAGLAVAFHPVVGVWGIGCAVYASLWIAWRNKSAQREPTAQASSKSLLIAGGVGLVCALPGLVPVLSLVFGEQHPESARANRIQVLERLPHHLDPTHFRKIETESEPIHAAWIAYAGLFVFWLGIRRRTTEGNDLDDDTSTWFFHFVTMSAIVAVCGLFIGWLPRTAEGAYAIDSPLFDLRVSLMKFYPFRLFDVLIPFAVAVRLSQLLNRADPTQQAGIGRVRDIGWNCGVFGAFLLFALLRPIPDRNPSHMTVDERDDWIAVCDWVRTNTPEDAQVLTPSSSWAFKWFAQRAEYDSHKDCPQDAAGILKWRGRRNAIEDWDAAFDSYSKEALRVLMEQEGITHIVCHSDTGPFAIAPVYPPQGQTNSRYRVYRLRDALDAAE